MQQEPRWSLVVPVKRLAAAKSRLAAFTGPHRGELALAVATDTVTAAAACPVVTEIVIVAESHADLDALRDIGRVHVVTDEPAAGLNPALRHGAAVAGARTPGTWVCALSADLPALRPAELHRVLAAAERHDHAFLADTAGTGTTAYTARPGTGFTPAFEGPSRRRHRESGASELTLADVASVRRDVDTPADLREAIALGVGPHTAKIVARLGL
ncbi:2-phospho-L-lactate guanylyltransferase [Salinactinospora qingdaonensis]|uniref:2-phospho-L-lactate guanylyltransferase n=1 Tax=Salinactinospora qingdaonensis TaxID=702744 RepID=UPI0031EB5580